jgi:molybdopterin-guanine dinucleotide biosynthesis protein A
MGENLAVLLLAGGEARRFPGKLERIVDGAPMLVRCYECLGAAGWPVWIAGKASFPLELDASIPAPLIVDRRPGKGPLRAFLDACTMLRADRVFAIAADQPNLDARVLHRLVAAWRPGDEAVVPSHDNAIEPLAALYDRKAALREGFELRASGRSAMRDLIGRLAARFVPFDSRCFHNVNYAKDLA